MIELDTKETIRRNRYRKPEPETKNEADPPTPRECGICGDTFYASAGFVCSQCKEERDARRSEKWEDPDEHFDPKDPSYKIYRRRLWIRHWEYPNPYDYIGRTGNERIMQRICGEYSFTKRFPELLLPSVEEDDVLIIRKFPWSVDGSDRSAVAEIVEILDSAIDPNTVTLNWQYVPKKMRQVGKWKAAQKIMRSAAMGLG